MTKDNLTEFTRLDALQATAPDEAKRQRGHDFESLLNDIFFDEGILLNRSYHTKDNRSEQIDSAISINSRTFLIEAKWVSSNLAASDLFSFIGKVENKFHGTLGIFISRNTLTDNFIRSLNRGRRQSVIVIHGEDIDLIFNNNVSFKEYIIRAFNVLSYDNISHYPVKSFLEFKEDIVPSQKHDSTTSKEAKKFIEEQLAKGVITGTDILLKVYDLGDKDRFDIYKYIIRNYSKFWRAEAKNFSSTITQNFDTYLEVCPPTEEQLKQYAGVFYSEIVPQSLSIYGRKEFSAPYEKFYQDITEKQRKVFESFIVKCMKEYFDNYELENYITSLIEQIWQHFQDETKDAMAEFIYKIFISYRLDKFAQKQFANRLMSKNVLGTNRLKQWLDSRIKANIDNYKMEEDDTDSYKYVIRFITSTYYKLAPALELGETQFKDYIGSRVYDITQENMK